MNRVTYSRRGVLYGSAVGAGALVLAACGGSDDNGGNGGNGSNDGGGGRAAGGKGSATTPLKPPSTLHESPELTKLVEAGKLPKLADRLPANPYVVPHKWLGRGKYGGQLTTVVSSTDGGEIKEFQYGSSILRYLNDGQDIGPGLVEHWDHNADASEWTLVFRKGLRWSDGQPFSTDDVLFWWNDLVLNPDHPDVPPDEMKSGKGTVATMKKVDDQTLKITFDAPAPLTADRLAMWTNGSNGNGPKWIVPSHFAKQFHPKYNKAIGKDWATANGAYDKNVDYAHNPKCPTMNAWMLESLKEGQEIRYVRNPYYWCVSKDGDQLPYIDTFLMRSFKEFKSGKLQIFQGNVDYLQGQFYNTDVSDIAALQDNADRANIEYHLWDTGSGTSAVFFLNYDHKNPAYRKLFREPKFRQALSFAYDRATVRKAVYYEQGEPTTGTMSPKAMEFQGSSEGQRIYRQWRDAYKAYDPKKANRLLDELGLKKGPDGFRTLPDGSPLKLTLDFPPDAETQYTESNGYLAKNLKAVGINAVPNPVPPDNYMNLWGTGQLTVRTATGVSDGPNLLVYPQWLVPVDNTRWAPLQGQWYALIGTPQAEQGLKKDPFASQPPRMQPEKGSAVERLWTLYNRTKTEPDEMKRTRAVWEMIKIHVGEGPFFIGTVANTPRVIVKKRDLKNVPSKENLFLGGYTDPWVHPTPAVYDPDTYYWEDPSKHRA